MAKDLVDVQRIADAYKKDGHKVDNVKVIKAGHYQFKRVAPDGRTFIHIYEPKGSKIQSGPSETPAGIDPADFEGHSDAVSGVKRGRGRPKGSKSGAR